MLRFCFGASGSGKSTGLIEEIINRSLKEVGTDFLIIVPDQFTMQTQKDVVRMHPSHAIMNIDVLSFGRLSHRVFEETSKSSFSVLDDVGKSLVLRRVADILGDRLPVIGRNMHKPGYIDEVKSTISEFMQYGISDEALKTLEDKSLSKATLNSKIKDLRLLYSEFLKYIQGKFITTEETLDILCRAIPRSSLLKDAVIVFDGFTGFTPIQYRVIKELMRVSKEVCVSLTIGPEEDPYASTYEEQELFMLTKKTVLDLERAEYSLLKENSIIADGGPTFEAWRNIRNQEMASAENGDIFIKNREVKRLINNSPLAFLEQNLFRYNSRKYEDEQDSIQIYEAQTMEEEVRQTMIKIRSLVTGKGYAYRDIAVVCGNLGSYANLIKRAAVKFDVPVYIDQNTGLMLNPFIEYITSAINIVVSGYRYEDVFHYMRSGMTDFTKENTDLLENYVRALGIKGVSAWEDRFMRRMPARFRQRKGSEESENRELELVGKLEGMRASISSQLKPLFDAKAGTAAEITDALLKMIEENACREKLIRYKDKFVKRGDTAKAKEYEQVFDKTIGIFRQISELIGDDKLDLREYKDILNVGFGDIEVGTIPQDVDRIIVGDIERTRLREIKALFFMGVNDDSIPAGTGGGGILSDMDRQYLLELDTGVELAPTPRQQMYIQRLYLYMNLTKPTDKLFLSYSELGSDGKSVRPAYLVPKIMSLYENIEVTRPEDAPFEEQTSCIGDSMGSLAEMLREYSLGILGEREKKNLSTLYKVIKERDNLSDTSVPGAIQSPESFLDKLMESAFKHYEDRPLAKNIALALYGANLENSVSRLEKFASCCYAHFLRYGLGLSERNDYDFDSSDLGTVFHEVLEKYTGEIIKRDIQWRDLSKEESDEILNRALTECIDAYGDTILLSNSRNQFMAERIKRILTRTVDTLKYQISKGKFEPAHVEMNFREAGNLEEINIALTEDEKHNIIESMKLHGRIDRIDLCEDSDHVYVKVIDFKSGGKKLSLASLYYGLQLQLVMYMNVAAAATAKNSGGKEVVPAAILYYHVEDPMVKGTADLQPDVINKEILKELRTTGLVNEKQEIINMLDNSIDGASDVIPVGYTKAGSLTASSSTVSSEDYSAISGFVDKKIREFGRNILNGDIKVNPYEMDNRDACKYCGYRGICGYDDKIPGYSKRELDLDDKDALERIKNEC